LPGANPPDAHIYMFNVRYGAQMVVPAALFLSVLIKTVSTISFLRSLGGGKLSHGRRQAHVPTLHSRLYVRVMLMVVILAQSALIASQGIITLQDGQYNYACGSRLTVGAIVDYLAEHYAGGEILQDIYTTKVDPAEFGVDFKDIIYVGSAQLWLQALRDPVDSVEWIIVNPDNKNDLVARHIDVKSPIFLSQFMLVAGEADGLLLYYRRDEAPLPTRPAPPIWKGEHYPC